MPFDFTRLEIPEVVLVKPKRFGDNRGFFMETYKYSDFAAAGIAGRFVQDNQSRSSQSVLRGLHYQKDPVAQGKLVRCLSGGIFDVAVDIRKGSPTYGRWVAGEITGENGLMLYVPPGFAHGFLVLSGTADILYMCTEEYSPVMERGIIWNDPDLGIAWPPGNPVLSEKDKDLPRLKDADNDFSYVNSGGTK